MQSQVSWNHEHTGVHSSTLEHNLPLPTHRAVEAESGTLDCGNGQYLNRQSAKDDQRLVLDVHNVILPKLPAVATELVDPP